MGDVPRESLQRAGWRVVTRAAALVASPGWRVASVHRRAYERQIAWMSEVRLGEGAPVVRACVTSFRTKPSDIEWVVGEMSRLPLLEYEVQA